MDRDNEVQFWRDAANRKRREGEPATAITFDNMAWLLAHPEGWSAWIEEQKQIALSKPSA